MPAPVGAAGHAEGHEAEGEGREAEGVAQDAAVRAAAETGLGIERDAEGLRSVLSVCSATPGMLSELASMVARAAEARAESRGAHQRSDAPETDPRQSRRRGWLQSPSGSPYMQNRETRDQAPTPTTRNQAPTTRGQTSTPTSTPTPTPTRGSLASC